MERTIKLLHEGCVAYYNIEQDENGDITAQLLQYNGKEETAPPQELLICKDGRLRRESGTHQELLDDVVQAIELSQLNNDLLFSPRKKYYE